VIIFKDLFNGLELDIDFTIEIDLLHDFCRGRSLTCLKWDDAILLSELSNSAT